MKKRGLVLIGVLLTVQLFAVNDTIILDNPSFEDTPRRGTLEWGYYSPPPNGWYDCGRVEFPRETPPDIHPLDFWEVERPAADGNTYLGMVVRDVDTWESVSQRLSTPMKANSCYRFSISLCRSDQYVSISQELDRMDNYTIPTVLRIWGGDGHCGRKELLAETDPISNLEWESYNFTFNPSFNHRYIVFEAFYKTPTLFAYNGHLLLDNASDIIEFSCSGEEELAMVDQQKPAETSKSRKPAKPRNDLSDSSIPTIETKPPSSETIENPSSLLTQLNRNELKKGQIIRIEKLYFEADSTLITESSYPVLDEIFKFLRTHKDIVVEIGGHTNGNFGITHDYCDNLSNERAKAVAKYIMQKGISPKRLQYKGYGKRFPIATNRTKDGRQKNQRVEIKILSLES